MPFVKLDCGILHSTLWLDRAAREVFITALLLAEPREYTAPEPTYLVTLNELDGFVVPPGWYGFVPAAGPAIAAAARVPEVEATQALERLASPDTRSRNPIFDGRRLVRVAGGFVLLNYVEYREKDHGARERTKRYRARIKAGSQPDPSRPSRVTNVTTRRDVTYAYADAESEDLHSGSRSPGSDSSPPDLPSQAPAAPDRPKVPRGTRLPGNFELTPARRQIAVNEGLAAERTFASFCDYWAAKPGANGTKLDWDATWRNWCRTEADRIPGRKRGYQTPKTADQIEAEERARA